MTECAAVSRSRLSQIMKLLDLEPGVQAAVMRERSRVAERGLRATPSRVLWEE